MGMQMQKETIRDDPKLLGDGCEVPQPNGVVGDLIPDNDKFFTFVKSASLPDGNPHSVFPEHGCVKETKNKHKENDILLHKVDATIQYLNKELSLILGSN